MVGVLAIVLLVAGGCASDRQVISQAQQMHAGLAPAVMNDPELTNYLTQVGDRIINAAKELDAQGYGSSSHRKEDSQWMFSQNMKFHLVNSKTMNAFTTGGEHMYIYNALFQNCKSEDELAAVMAHEFGHVYGRHVQSGMNRQYAAIGGVVAAGAAGYAVGGKDHGGEYAAAFAGAAGLAAPFILNGFTRSDETEADEMGFLFYCRAGWDPNRFADFFQSMIDMGYDTTPEIVSDHPSLKNRVAAVKEWIKKLPPGASNWRRPPVADAAKFTALKARAEKLSLTMPSDNSMEKAQELLAAFPSCVSPIDQPGQKEARQEVLEVGKTGSHQ